MEDQESGEKTEKIYGKAKASRFHFKDGSKRRSRRREHADHEDEGDEPRRKRHRSSKEKESGRSHRDSERRHRHDPHRDHHTTSTRDGTYYDPNYRHRESLYDDIYDKDAPQPDMAPDDAFRESLFDALADDEGAAYWEGVYGQPVHIYPDTKPGPDGKLERMTEEEYAEYVRAKMWEKTHQHIVEQREARERERKKRREQRQHLDEDLDREEAERGSIRRQMAESLKRGEERKKAKQALAAWEEYTKKWDNLKNTPGLLNETASDVRHMIPWPVISGNAKHISRDEIERFLRASSTWKEDPTAVLKVERVRWHPDKMQQRFGQHVDTETMKSVTAVFQIIDQLWNDKR